MADDDDARRVSSWRKAAKQQGAQDAAQKALLKRAMEVNPELKGNRKTEEVFAEVQAAKRGVAQGEAAPVQRRDGGPIPPPEYRNKPLPAVIEELKRWLEAEQQRIAERRARATEARKALAEKKKTGEDSVRAEVLAALRAADPTLASPMTKTVLDAHAAFLRRIGLDAQQLRAAIEGSR